MVQKDASPSFGGPFEAEELDFEAVGISSWKVRKTDLGGLVYDFDDVSAVLEALRSGKISSQDEISHHLEGWTRITGPEELEKYFQGLHERKLGGKDEGGVQDRKRRVEAKPSSTTDKGAAGAKKEAPRKRAKVRPASGDKEPFWSVGRALVLLVIATFFVFGATILSTRGKVEELPYTGPHPVDHIYRCGKTVQVVVSKPASALERGEATQMLDDIDSSIDPRGEWTASYFTEDGSLVGTRLPGKELVVLLVGEDEPPAAESPDEAQ